MKWSRRIWTVLMVSLLLLPTTGSAYSNLYILGDSLSDTGNLLTATGTLPQPPYVNGRFSDGPVYAEYLWKSLGMPGELKPSYRGGSDYAVGGARSSYHAFDLLNPGFFPVGGTSKYSQFTLLGQRDAFLFAKGGVLDPGALYTVWSGSNDVSDAIDLKLKSFVGAATALIAQAASNFIQVVTDLVKAGARYLFIPNVPNLGLVPEVLALNSPDAQGIAIQLSAEYNALVDQGLAGIAAEITRLDTFSILTDLVADPEAFGLPGDIDVTTACFSGFVAEAGDQCSDPQNHVFWDKIHPSAVVHQELGRLAAAAVPEPASIVLAALALLALGYFRRSRLPPAKRCLVAAASSSQPC